jgi:hypothetical protein
MKQVLICMGCGATANTISSDPSLNGKLEYRVECACGRRSASKPTRELAVRDWWRMNGDNGAVGFLRIGKMAQTNHFTLHLRSGRSGVYAAFPLVALGSLASGVLNDIVAAQK